MKGKKQLNENTIRRFMKLASIGSLTENFLDEGEEEDITEAEEEPVEEGKAGDMGRKDVANKATGRWLKEEEELEDVEEPVGDPEMEPEMDLEMEPEMDPEGAVGTIDVEEFMQAFQQALEQVTGQEVEVETGEEPPMDEPPMDEPPMDEPEMDEPPARDIYEELLEDVGVNIIDEDEVVSEVVRRVAKRLVGIKLRK